MRKRRWNKLAVLLAAMLAFSSVGTAVFAEPVSITAEAEEAAGEVLEAEDTDVILEEEPAEEAAEEAAEEPAEETAEQPAEEPAQEAAEPETAEPQEEPAAEEGIADETAEPDTSANPEQDSVTSETPSHPWWW